MIKEIEILLPAVEIDNENYLLEYISKIEKLDIQTISGYQIIKKSLDARRKPISYLLKIRIYINESLPIYEYNFDNKFNHLNFSKQVIIIGCGPAGLFAALKLLEHGIKPIIFERGKDVANRKLDIASINRNISLNSESNWCFGEGGAGTFSDGKLFTRSKKKGDIDEILELLIANGADECISYESHAHIGTDKLPNIITNIRHTIIKYGGEVHFNTKIVDIITQNNEVISVVDGEGNRHKAYAFILATGHSASDIFEIFEEKKFAIEFKPFALGVRIEHPQELIDKIQYKSFKRPDYLPAASYNLVQQVDGKGVFSFCMCPGGTIVPASTIENQIVVNGMSNSQRNSPFANAGIVVSIDRNELKQYQKYRELAGLRFQQEIEHKAWALGGKTLKAPAQRMVDFVNDIVSNNLPINSYNPGLVSCDLKLVLPHFISEKLKKAFLQFNEKMRGFYTNDAILVGVESRTSSPVRIPRDSQMLNHIQLKNLYPAGEGSGYAGGILSSAIDGQRCAEAISQKI